MTFPPHRELWDERRRGDRASETTSDDLVGAVVRLMPDAAIVVDDNGTVVASNMLAERLFGYQSAALAGKQVDQLVPERLRSKHAGHRATYTAHPTQRPMGEGIELWAKRRDGTELPVEISLAPLGVPERPLTLAAIRDLTQRRAEWAALGRLAAIVAASDDAIVSVDLKGSVTSWNPGAQQLFGYLSEEIVGRPIFRLVPPDRRVEAEEQLARVRGGLRIPTRDTRRLRKNGEEIDVSESVSLIRDPSDEPIGLAWLMSDITERKLAELELRRLLTETQRRERWLEAISDIRLTLLAGGGLSEWLELIARRVCELVDTDSSAILLTTEIEGSMVVAAAEGDGFTRRSDEELYAQQVLFGRITESGGTWTTESSRHGDGQDRRTVSDLELGVDIADSMVVAPLTTSEGVSGVLAVSRSAGRAPLDRVDVRMVESFAQQVGVAVEIARAQSDREQLTLVADRERIARDLHDHVIQRLFAVGMALQAAAHSITDSHALERISDSVEELDATIRGVRSTIFSL
ncbi:MAG: PAS domain S-box protein, partial [Acidimicrobiales bacterium]